MDNKAIDEARNAVRATPEFKDWEKAYVKASKALKATSEWKAVVATPEYEAYEKAGGTCKELRRGLNNGYNSYFKDNSVSDRIYRRISHSVYRA